MLNYVIDAKYIEDYKIWIAFDDGKEGEVNLEKKVKNGGEIFEPLINIDYFQNFKVENDTISWKNGADFSPESLYELIKSKNK